MASTSQAESAIHIHPIKTFPQRSETTTSVQVIHIPANGSPILNPKFTTLKAGHQDLHGIFSKETQQRLELVPNLKKYGDQGDFAWDHRGLFELDIPKDRVLEGSKGLDGCYLMYKCITPEC